MVSTGPVANATFFLYSGESLFSSCFGACVVLPGVMGGLERGEEVGGAMKPFFLRLEKPWWCGPSVLEERASDVRFRECEGDRVGKLMTCSRKCVE
jgi:hypothetical protein